MKVVIIGEECKDIFRYGNVIRLNPEAPSPIFMPVSVKENFGMAANVRKNLESFFDVLIDPFGSMNYGELPEILSIVPDNATIIKERYIEEQHNYILLRVDSNDYVDQLIFSGKEATIIEKADYCIVSDYNKGFLSKDSLALIAEISSGYDKISFLDTKKPLGYWAKDFTWIKINSSEFDNPAHDQEFLEEYKDKIIVTLGKNGAKIGDNLYIPEHRVDIMDVSGAGDTFLAAFAFGIMLGADTEKSIRYANFMAGKAVSFKGVVNAIAQRINKPEFMIAFHKLIGK